MARVLAVTAVALTVANCSQQKFGSNGIDPKYGVRASPRVVGPDDPAPKGGGRDLVGKPYVVGGRTYVPRENPHYVREGLASWYGRDFHGRMTANGEVFDRFSIAAAHPTMPLPSYARVTNLRNHRSIIVRVNDRGPYHSNRIMDVSQRVAEALEFKAVGTAPVRVEYVGRASTRGSDDTKLLATLRIDGHPAPYPGQAATMVADASDDVPAPRQALAFRSAAPQPEEAPERAPALAYRASAPAPVVVASAAPVAPPVAEPMHAANVPLPPERPFDLGTIPNAASPVPAASAPFPVARAVLPPQRPVMAGLFYAAPDVMPSRFDKRGPFAELKPQRFISFKKQL